MTTGTIVILPTNDTYIRSDTATTNYGGSNSLSSGQVSAAGVRRTFLKFDFDALPANATITAITLSMKVSSDSSTNVRTKRVYRMKRAWVDLEATWNKADAANNWTAAGGFDPADCEQTDVGSVSFSATEAVGTVKTFTLDASKFQEIKAGTWTDNGLMIKTDTETTDCYNFYSVNESAANSPYLTITFTVPAKAELNSQSSGNTGASAAASLTISHTVNAGNNRLLLVGVSYGSSTAGKTATGVTWDGNAMTLLDTTGNTSNVRTDLWYYVAPAVKTANVIISFDASIYGAAVCVTFNEVKQASGIFLTDVLYNASTDSAFLNSALAVDSDQNLAVDVVGKVSSAGTMEPAFGQCPIATNKSTNATAANNRQVGMSWRGGINTSVYMGWNWQTGVYYASDVAASLGIVSTGRQFQSVIIG